MFQKIKEFFLGKPKAQEPVAEAPYKIEAPSVDAPATPKKKRTFVKREEGAKAKAPAEKPAAAAKKPRAKKTTTK